MNTFNQTVTVNAVEVRRNAGQAVRVFKALRDAGIDTGRGRLEATAAAALAVDALFPGVGWAAALGLTPGAARASAQHEAKPTAARPTGGDDADPAPAQPEAGESRGREPQARRSSDPRALFPDLTAPAFDADLAEAFSRLASLWDREPDADRLPGDAAFVDDGSLRAAGVSLWFAHDFAKALAREDRFSAAGWVADPERDHGHGLRRLEMLSPDFLIAATEHVDLMIAAGYGASGGSRPGRTLRTTTVSGIAGALVLGLERGADGTFRVPGTPARHGLRAV